MEVDDVVVFSKKGRDRFPCLCRENGHAWIVIDLSPPWWAKIKSVQTGLTRVVAQTFLDQCPASEVRP